MNKKYKKVLSLILAVTITFSLCACKVYENTSNRVMPMEIPTLSPTQTATAEETSVPTNAPVETPGELPEYSGVPYTIVMWSA